PRTPIGARYLISRPQISADFSLLLLPSVPQGVTFAEWEANDPAPHAEVTGIHHPRGAFKRISSGTLTGTYWEIDYSEVPRQNYHQVLWNAGIVEPGSSGSPLFNSAKKVIGVLSYGYRIGDYEWCDIKPSIAAYGRFSVAYGLLRSYLDDPPPGTLNVAPDRVSYRVENRAVTPGPVQRLVARTPDGAPIQVASDSPWLAVRQSGGSWELELKPNLISRSGFYTALVSVTSSGLTKTVPVAAEVTLRPSAVAVSATPNPVPSGEPDADGCQWSFAVTLDEKSGVATTLSRVRFGGYDLTGQAEQMFGASRLAANGKLEAKLRYCGAAGEHVLEFAGVDDATRLTWNRSIAVEFKQ
ncbi:MAG TPA: hypothetical protein DEH78_06005, partial [Solibacterales bacterium]|nr:hypothetical protein [Bryobacterales bacterium]